MRAAGLHTMDPICNPQSTIRNWFFLSVLLLFYGTLFPFDFDFSAVDWSQFSWIPYWVPARGRIHSLPDMAGNALLTVPLGFFGFLWSGRQRSEPAAKWLLIGFLLGLVAELTQMALPSRHSSLTDALNNGLGCFAGAAAASLFGRQLMDLLSGSLFGQKQSCFLVLVLIATAYSLLPFDFGTDVAHVKWSLKQIWRDPWEAGRPPGDEWVAAAQFAIIGALAGLMRHRKALALAFLLPLFLEGAQVLVESHAPSVRDAAMNLAGAAAGLGAARFAPGLVRPEAGFALISAALFLQGLSPYRFGAGSAFEWIPLVEYYRKTTGGALYDALGGMLSYGLLGVLWPRKSVILWSILLAGAIEGAQLFIDGRSPGVTDVLIAALGSWTGWSLAKCGRR